MSLILPLLVVAAGCTAGTGPAPSQRCSTFRPTAAQVRADLTRAMAAG